MFPSTLSTFARPTTTDRLNNPSHSALHNTVSSAVGQIEAVIGLSTSSAVGSLMYDVRSPDSDGGGHVQTANKGGTGQTSYTKGDLLVATSSSVVAKLAVGADGLTIVSDSSVAAGLKWGTPRLTKIIASVLSSIVAQGTVAETSIFSIAIPGSTLGTNNAVRATVNVRDMTFEGTTASVILQATYGGARVASVLIAGHSSADLGNGTRGKFEFTLFGNGVNSAQAGDLFVSTGKNGSVLGTYNMASGTSSVASDAPANIGMTVRYSTDSTNNGVRVGGIVIEKIV